MQPLREHQRGQAIIGVMVVMVILFAAAGAVALAASSLLAGRGQSRTAIDDFQVRSAVSDSVAQVAGSQTRCWAPLAVTPPPPTPSPSPTPTPSPTSSPSPSPTPSPTPSPIRSPTPSPAATPLTLGLPGGAAVPAYCAREDAVVAGSVQRFSGTGGCATVDLRSWTGRVAVVFDVRTTSSGWAYVDGNPRTNCNSLPDPDDIPATCLQRIGTNAPPVVQVALSCNFKSSTHVQLHVNLPTAGPGSVFAARQDPSANPGTLGSLYLLASGTGLANPDYEESVLFVSSSANRLVYEGRLP